MEGLVLLIGLGAAFAVLAGLIAFFRDINLGSRIDALERRCAQQDKELRDLQAQRTRSATPPAAPAAPAAPAMPPPHHPPVMPTSAAGAILATVQIQLAPLTAPVDLSAAAPPAASAPAAIDQQSPLPPALLLPGMEEPVPSVDAVRSAAVLDRLPSSTSVAPLVKGPAQTAPPAQAPAGTSLPARPAALRARAAHNEIAAEKLAQAAAWARFEDVVGRRWLSWLGAFLVFVAGGFAVRYCMVHSIIGPLGRLIGGCAFAATVVVTGDILVRRGWRAFGQGVLGLGLLLGYAVLFAAYAYPEARVLSQSSAFLAMIALTALGVWRSVRYDALAIATLATIGGLLTPVLLSSGHGSRDALLAYLLLLDAGVLGAALWRRWPVLNSVAFLGTEAMIGVWWAEQGTAAGQLAMAYWAMAFWLVFGAVAVAYRLRWRALMAAEGYLLAAANAIVTLVALHCALHATLGIEALFAGAVGLGYGLLAMHAERLFGGDRLARGGFGGLAAMSLTAIVPMLLGGSPLTAAWAAEAILLAWLCRRHVYAPLGVFAVIVLTIAMVSGLVHAHERPIELPVLNAGCAFDVLVLGAALAVALLLTRAQAHPEQVRAAGWVAMSGPLWLAIRLGYECMRWGYLHNDLLPAWAQASVCAAGCAALPALARGWTWAEERLRTAIVLLSVAAVTAVVPMVRSLADAEPVSGPWDPRFIALGAVAAVGLLIARLHWPAGARTIIHALAWWCAASWHAAVALAHAGSAPGSTAGLAAIGWAVAAAGAAVMARPHGGTPVQPLILSAGAMLCVLVGHGQHDWSGASLFNGLTAAGIIVTAALGVIASQARDPLRGWIMTAGAAWLMVVLHLDLYCSGAPATANDFDHPQQIASACWLVAGALTALAAGSRTWWHSFSTVCAIVVVIISLGGYLGPLPIPRALLHPSFVYGAGAMALLARLTHLAALRGGIGWHKLLAGVLLWGWVLITLEAFSAVTALGMNPIVRLVAVTIAWSVYAMVLLTIGFRLRLRPLRITALGLFALTVAKLALFDLAYLHDLARILSFLVAGALLMAGSWAYQRLERRFGQPTAAAKG